MSAAWDSAPALSPVPWGEDLALPFGEGREHVHLQARERAGVRVDVAGDDGEPDAMALEERGEAREIGELPCEPLDAVDDDAVDVSLLDALQELGEAGTLESRAALALVVEALGDRVPELPGLVAGELGARRPRDRAGRDGGSSPERLIDCRV